MELVKYNSPAGKSGTIELDYFIFISIGSKFNQRKIKIIQQITMLSSKYYKLRAKKAFMII